ncbi:MAG TPA: hypothetical protein VI957_01940 [Candidatus Paceibacterota bacterium]
MNTPHLEKGSFGVKGFDEFQAKRLKNEIRENAPKAFSPSKQNLITAASIQIENAQTQKEIDDAEEMIALMQSLRK